MNFYRHAAWGALAVLLALPSSSFAQPAAGPIVDAPAGAVQGVSEGALNVFKGIPYAQPPVGPLRWRAPSPLPRWADMKTATAFGASCVQPISPTPNLYTDDVKPMSENCLSLNIWAPKNAQKAPVFFWIYGGALVGGSSREPIYDGAKLAARGVVVVTINYRLGVLGWLAHPQLSAESPMGVSGNYGLLDQVQALHWVKDNIGAFGGDASNVTIAGESAGALSVMYLLAAPPAHGLFAKAIAESAYLITTPPLKEKKYGYDAAEQSGTALGAKLNAPTIAQLRAMDPLKLTDAAVAAGFAPFGAVDGKILPDQLVTIFDKGEQAPVPLLAGFNSGEIRSLRVLAPQPPASAAIYESTIRSQYLDLADAFLSLYPSSNMNESILATTRDSLYGWTAERLVKKQTALGQQSYLYLFDHGYPAEDAAGLHGFHASELPYVFGTPDRTGPLWPKIPSTPQETALSDAMIGYWTSFAKTGKPVAANAPDWPLYGTAGAYMAFIDAPHPADNLLPGMYKLNEEVMCRRRGQGDQQWGFYVGLWSPKMPPKAAGCE